MFATNGQIRNLGFTLLRTGVLSISAIKTKGRSPGPALVLCREITQTQAQ